MLLILTYRPFYTFGGSSANQLLYIHFFLPTCTHTPLCERWRTLFSI